jgi:hypothetical protein
LLRSTSSFGRCDAVRDPPLSKVTPQQLDSVYVERAKKDIALRLSCAGVRLAVSRLDALPANRR